jgi:hypothetical protein
MDAAVAHLDTPPPAPRHADGPVDFFFIVCSPNVSPLTNALPEAQASAACVERAGLTALVWPERPGQSCSLSEVNRLMLQRRPRVVVFIGHADAPHATSRERTLGLTDDFGRLVLMNPETIDRVLKGASKRPELVFLNGCYSVDRCKVLSAPEYKIPSIGWSTQAADAAAKIFALALLESLLESMCSLGEEQPIPRRALHAAFEHGKTSVVAAPRRLASPKGTSDMWALVDPELSLRNPDGSISGELEDGRLAAGVPTLLLPPRLSPSVPPVADRLIVKPTEVCRIATALTTGGAGITSVQGGGGGGSAGIPNAGVHGMGGAGKSTLAACIARDPLTHGSVCPGGAAWVVFGEEKGAEAGLQELVGEVASLLGASVPGVMELMANREEFDKMTDDEQEKVLKEKKEEFEKLPPLERGRRQLKLLLEGRRVLVVVDDVWHTSQALPIKQVVAQSGGSRLLLTSRDGSIIRLLGAAPFLIELLQGDDALRLMGSWAIRANGQPWTVEELRADADAMRLAALCGVGEGKAGGLPLALQTVGSEASELGWAGVLEMLTGDDLGELDPAYHPHDEQYRTLFAALCVSLKTLKAEVRERYVALSIFREDERIPLDILGRLWQTSEPQTKRTVAEFVKRSLVIEGGVEQGYVRLHDLQRESVQRAAREEEGRTAEWHKGLLRRCGAAEIGVRHGGPREPIDKDERNRGYWAAEEGRRRFLHHVSDASFGCEEELGELGQVRRLDLGGMESLTRLPLLVRLGELRELILAGCSSLQAIELPAGLTSIGGWAFAGCSSQQAIELPAGLASIGHGAFHGCSSLQAVELPAGLTSIGKCAFFGCSSLSVKAWAAVIALNPNAVEAYRINAQGHAVVPDGITSLRNNAFRGCSSLQAIELPAGLTSIGEWAFYGCSSLQAIELPAGLTSIGRLAFNGCSSLQAVELPAGLTSIGECAFAGCSSLQAIELPAGLTTIDSCAFACCSSLSAIELPAGLTSIGWRAFAGCSSLQAIELPAGLTSIGKFAFNGCSLLQAIELPAGLTSIGECAFDGCSSLQAIELPAGLASIGKCAFFGCSSLSEEAPWVLVTRRRRPLSRSSTIARHIPR